MNKQASKDEILVNKNIHTISSPLDFNKPMLESTQPPKTETHCGIHVVDIVY